ncbi:hypothetical protein C8R47DRAFT_1215873 [Mycena vitilis]|nr:hypothetical protein C8R47DRAFT_1215873 [Mycena vitilis]
MARSAPTPPKPAPTGGTTCEHCGASVKRPNDLPRHMLLHATNKEEFMFTCPVEGCGHSTLQKSNLNTHIRTHTRAKPYKCPEYYPNGQKCLFATADPSSLHRHRKRKHGFKPQSSTTSNGPLASGSGSRGNSVESTSSFESEESFGLRPEASDADGSTAGPSTADTLAYPIYDHYLPSNKLSGYHCASPYYPPLDLKIPDWIGSPAQLPSTFQFDCGLHSENVFMSPADFAFPQDFEFYWACGLASQGYPLTSTPSPLRLQPQFGVWSFEATAQHEPGYLELPADLFPYRSTSLEQRGACEW